MATANCTANNLVAQVLVTVPFNKKARLLDLSIDNQGTSGAITTRLQDLFTPNLSVGVPGPTPPVTDDRFQATVPQGVSFDADVLSLKGKEFIGNIQAIASATDAGCAIIATYEFF
jgi:hypothetical protein